MTRISQGADERRLEPTNLILLKGARGKVVGHPEKKWNGCIGKVLGFDAEANCYTLMMAAMAGDKRPRVKVQLANLTF